MKTIFAKYNNERLPKYQVVTKIVKDEEGKKITLKETITDESSKHLINIYENYRILKSKHNIDLVKPTKEGNVVFFEFAKGESLESILLAALSQNNTQKFERYIKKFLNYVDSMVSERNVLFNPSNDFLKVFGEWRINEPQDIINIANIDLIFGNIFVDENDHFTLIDYEWVFEFDVPKSYIIWRSLNYFSSTHSVDVSGFLDFNQHDKFTMLNNAFSDFVFGEKRKYFLPHGVKKNVTSINLYNEELSNSFEFIQLFIEDKKGIVEESSIKFPLSNTTELKLFEFNVSSYRNIRSFRLDPLNDYCIVKINCVLIDGMEQTIKSSNAYYVVENIYYFNTDDPQIYFDPLCLDNINNIFISLEYIHTNKEALIYIKDQTIEMLNAELVQIYLSKSWRITRFFRKIIRRLKI